MILRLNVEIILTLTYSHTQVVSNKSKFPSRRRNYTISWIHATPKQKCKYKTAPVCTIFIIAEYRGFIYINGHHIQIVFMFYVRATPVITNQNINVNSNGGKKSYYANETF